MIKKAFTILCCSIFSSYLLSSTEAPKMVIVSPIEIPQELSAKLKVDQRCDYETFTTDTENYPHDLTDIFDQQIQAFVNLNEPSIKDEPSQSH